MTSLRQRRVAEFLREEIGLIVMDLADPRLTLIDVTDVEVSADLRNATVFFSHLGEEEERQEVIQALGRASGYIRRELALRGGLRYVPELCFRWDASAEQGRRIDDLLRQIGLG